MSLSGAPRKSFGRTLRTNIGSPAIRPIGSVKRPRWTPFYAPRISVMLPAYMSIGISWSSVYTYTTPPMYARVDALTRPTELFAYAR